MKPTRLRLLILSLFTCYNSNQVKSSENQTKTNAFDHREYHNSDEEDKDEKISVSDVADVVDYFYFIPDDILLRILSFLDDEDWEVCKLVCKKWHFMHCKIINNLSIYNQIDISDCRKLISTIDSYSNLKSITIVDHRRQSSIPLLQKLSTLSIQIDQFNYSCHFRSKNSHQQHLPSHHDLIFKTLSTHTLIRKLYLKFMDDDKLILDLSPLIHLKHLSIDANIHSLTFTSDQMQKIEELTFITPLRNILVCLSRLFGSETVHNWQSLEITNLVLRLENFMDLDLELLRNCLFLIPNLKNLELYGGSGIGYDLSLDLGQITNLSKLVLSFGNLAKFPQWIFQLRNLTSLTLFKLQSIESISILSNLPCLKRFKLTIEGKDDRDGKNEQNLQYIQEMTGLQSLYLHCDYINIIFPSFYRLLALEELDLRVNFAVKIYIKGIVSLPSLHSLGLKFSNIPRIHVDLNFQTCLKLNRLSANFSIIRNLAHNLDVSKLIREVNKLTFLTLRFNELQDMDMRLISNFSQLTHLELFDSKTEDFPDSFSHLTRLAFFKIQGFSELRSLTFLQNCPLLKTLRIHNAPKLCFVSEALFDLKFVREIQIFNCPKLASYENRFRKMAFRFVSQN